MLYFAQQLINGLTLGAMYGLIAIGYSMVYGIIGMINFAHGEIYMIGAFLSIITFTLLGLVGITWVPLALLLVFFIAMLVTAAYGWTVERVAYRPLRGSFRLAPLISAIGMSIFLQNYVQITQGASVKPLQPVVRGGLLLGQEGTFTVQVSWIQLVIVALTIVLMVGFALLIARTPLGRAQRACEQDQKMAGLCGVNVDRTISLTFVLGASLAAVAGVMATLYYGVIDFFIGFLAGIKAFTAAVLGGIGSIPGAMLGGLLLGLVEAFWSGYFSIEYKDVAAFSILIIVLVFLPTGLLGRPEIEKVRAIMAQATLAAPATAPGPALKAAVQEAAVAALLALVLLLPIVGLRTAPVTGGGLTIVPHLPQVAIGCALVFAGRLVMALTRGRLPALPAGGLAAVGQRLEGIGPWLIGLMLAAAIVLPLTPFADRYTVDIATTVLIYIMLGWGLNIVVGLAGLLDLGYVAFYAVGAYSFALFAQWFGLGFWAALPIAGALAATFGILLGFPVLRLRGDYLAIVTLGFGEIIRIVLLNWSNVTNGPNGIGGIPRPSFFGFEFTRNPPEGATAFHQLFGLEFSSLHRVIFLYYVILVLALLTNLFVLRIRRLPIGRAWEALREDEIACKALGINPTNTKLTAFALGAMFGGFAGSFFATRQGFISPESFTFIESAIILAIVVLGGMGSQIGVVLAAAIVVLLPELGRGLEQYRMLIFGLAMVAIMVWRPRGLMAHRAPTIRLGRDRAAGPSR